MPNESAPAPSGTGTSRNAMAWDSKGRPNPRRWAALLAVEGILLGVIAGAFWHQEWRYLWPAPIPPGHTPPAIGATLPAEVRFGAGPVLLNFLSPDCPCSRFSVDHLHALANEFGGQVRMVAVLPAGTSQRVVTRTAEALGFAAIADSGSRLAARTGVYATPQAVLIDGDGRLAFRGNYNRGRYCRDPRTADARLALIDLLAGRGASIAGQVPAALGCPLPIPPADLVRADAR